MKKTNEKTLSRRQFLKSTGVGAGSSLIPSTLISNLVFQGILEKALAQQQVTGQPRESFNYAIINLAGGPPRWYFDLPLEARTGSGLHNPSQSFGNCFKEEAGVLRPDYKSAPFTNVAGKTFHLPYIWNQTVSTSGGNFRLADALPNALFVRGMNNLIDGHAINNQMIVSPQLTDTTILGLNSDASARPFATIVNYDMAGLPHRGRRNNNTPVTLALTGPTMMSGLFAPFTDTQNIFSRKLSRGAEEKVKQTLEEFRVYAATTLKLNQADISSVQKVARTGMENFTTRAEEFNTRWTTTYERYKRIINDAIRPSLGSMPGINDKPIRLDGRPRDSYVGYVVKSPDLRTTANNNIDLPALAEVFAAIDFLFTQKLSSSISLSPSQLMVSGFTLADCRTSLLELKPRLEEITPGFASGIFDQYQANGIGYDAAIEAIRTQILSAGSSSSALMARFTAFNFGLTGGAATNIGNAGLAMDQHFNGASISIYFSTIFYRGLGACLNELISSLKGTGEFARTLLQVAGDFNRVPVKTGAGSEHGFSGSGTSFYSGMIHGGPYVVGNIVARNESPNTPGSWGLASGATIRPGVVRPIQPGDVANSVCSLLGIPPVSTNGHTIFERDPATGKMVLKVTECGET
jgi:hypothetical protein